MLPCALWVVLLLAALGALVLAPETVQHRGPRPAYRPQRVGVEPHVVFVVSGVLAGAGVGLVFNVALTTAGSVASPGRRGETLAGMFLAAYAGITVPVIAAGVALTWFPAAGVLVAFAGLVLAAVLVSTTRMLAHTRRPA